MRFCLLLLYQNRANVIEQEMCAGWCGSQATMYNKVLDSRLLFQRSCPRSGLRIALDLCRLSARLNPTSGFACHLLCTTGTPSAKPIALLLGVSCKRRLLSTKNPLCLPAKGIFVPCYCLFSAISCLICSMNCATGMVPWSPPERVRTDTSPLSTSRSPRTSM